MIVSGMEEREKKNLSKNFKEQSPQTHQNQRGTAITKKKLH